MSDTANCKHCGESIYVAFVDPRDDYQVWSHENQHTVCRWVDAMARYPSYAAKSVATPA